MKDVIGGAWKDIIDVICDDEYKISNLITDMALRGATDFEILEAAIYFASLKRKYPRNNDKEAYGSLHRYKVGDQIEVDLKDFGVFTATAQKIKDDSIIFMFDECITRMPMNYKQSNEGGYDSSGLCYWINAVLKNAFPEEIRQHITYISLPTYGQIFGHDTFYEKNLEPDNDDQFELIKKREDRIAKCGGDCTGYWLYNSTKSAESAYSFAYVSLDGLERFGFVLTSYGVRPVFALSV